jgi:hypothetical protein
MYGKSKRFSPSLHQSNDPKSRQVVKDYLARYGLIVADNTNKYGVDLVSADGLLQIEVEHRLPWVDETFPYSEVNVPERKAKFFKDGKVQYVILSRAYDRLGIILGHVIQPFIVDDNLVVNPNKFVRNDEYFFKIPIDLFKWVKV